MKVKIVGKQHMKGTSKKSGTPYDFYALYCLGKSSRVEGQICITVNVRPEDSPYADAVVGSDYNLEYDQNGYLADFAPITKG